MKTFTAVLLVAVISWCYTDVDAFFSFNFTGGIYPGFSVGKIHSRQQRYHLRNNKHDDDSNWPRPEHGHNVSEYPSKPIVSGNSSDDNERPHTQNHGFRRRNHRHYIL